MSSIRIFLRKVVEEDSWKAMLRHLLKEMTRLRLVGTRAFNHFVIFTVLNGELEITDDKVLSSVIRACFTCCTDHIYPSFMQQSEIGNRSCDRFFNWIWMENWLIKLVWVISLPIAQMNTWFWLKTI